MPRPLMQHGVGKLEEMFAKAKSDLRVLEQLENELKHRQVPRAVALLAEVQAAMNDGAPKARSVASPALPPATASTPSSWQPSLWERPPAEPAAVGPPPVQPRPATPVVIRPETPSLAKAPPPAPLTIPLEEAYKILKTKPGSTWESIEQARRLLVHQAHPSRVSTLSPEKRAQARAEAERVNSAYLRLSAARCERQGCPE